jgi:hypothetical protein
MTPVIGVTHFFGVDEQAAFLVHDERLFLPTVPQRATGLDDLVGAVVAQLFCRQIVEAEIARFEIGCRGHDVPAGPAMR